MTNRRAFIQTGLVAATAFTSAAGALSAMQPAAVPLHSIYFDERFGLARDFSREVARLGGRTWATRGNVHDFWYHDLAPRWRAQPVAVAGMTESRAVFLLAMMAADAGMRVVFRGHHVLQSSGSYVHEAFGSPAARKAVASFDVATTAWTASAARMVVRWPLAACSVAAATGTNVTDAARRAVGGDTLVSWVIAPVTCV